MERSQLKKSEEGKAMKIEIIYEQVGRDGSLSPHV